MATEKCFCHLNGYKVKDADARAQIENHEGRVQFLENLEILNEEARAVISETRARVTNLETREEYNTQVDNDHETKLNLHDLKVEDIYGRLETVNESIYNAQEDMRKHIQNHNNGVYDSDTEYGNAIENINQELSDIKKSINTLEQEDINLNEFDDRLSDRITALEGGGGGSGGGGLKVYLHKIVFAMNGDNPVEGTYINFRIYSTAQGANGTFDHARDIIRGVDGELVLSRKVGFSYQGTTSYMDENLVYLIFRQSGPDTCTLTTFYEGEIIEISDLSFHDHEVEEFNF